MNNKATFVKVRRILFIGFSFVVFLLPQFHTSAKTIISNDITSDTTWTKTGSPYIISTDVYIAPSVTLTIDPGVVVKFADSNGSIGVIGTLNAQGTSTKHITFTSYADDSLGGDSNNDGTSTAPSSGDFDGFYVGQNATLNLNYVDIRYAGDTLFANEGTATISNTTLTKVSSGLAFYKSTSTLSNITIDTTDSYPLQFYQNSTADLNNISIKNAGADALLIFNQSTVTVNGATVGDLSSSDSGVLVFNGSNLTASNLSIGSSYDGISTFNQATFSGDNITVASSTDAGIFAFSNSGWNNTTISLTNSEIKNNNFGLHFINNVTVGSITNNSIHGNTTGAKTEDTTNLDFSNNWWGSDTGPTHSSNTGGAGDVVSDYISYTPWLTEDPKNAGPDTYYSRIANAPNGVALLYDSPTTGGTLIKTLPNDFALKVVTRKNTSGNKLVADSFEWAKVIDPTDNTTHYTPYKNVTTKVLYLPYDKNIQTNLKDISETKITDAKDRKAVILDAVDDYYNNASTTKSLFSSDDNVSSLNISKLKNNSIPKELILAIFAQESGSDFDNENVSFDYGHGVSQVTMQAKSNSKKNADDPRGAMSLITLANCRNVLRNSQNQIIDGLDEYKKCYKALYNSKGKLYGQTYDNYDHSTANPLYKQYSNTAQSIYANIKDGLAVLSQKYSYAQNHSCSNGTITKDGYTFSCDDIKKIKTVWGYNGFGKDSTGQLNGTYMSDVSNKLKNLSKYFKGISYANTDNLIEKLAIANKYKQEVFVHSPVELQITDSNGNTTGLVNGTVQNDIENSFYNPETESALFLFPNDTYTYKVVGDGTGSSYGFDVVTGSGSSNTAFSATVMPIANGEIDTYTINQSKLSDNDPDAVTIAIDTNGDGTPEKTIQSGKELVTATPYDFYFKKIVDGGQYKVSKVLPIRIRVTSASKGKIPLQKPWIKVTRVSDGYKASINPNKLDEDGDCDSDDECFTKHHNRYILNLPKNTLTAGDWKIQVGLDDTVIHSIVVTMIK
ncbi:MAG: right-handed parallel beta-helix repeat-containing protein [bacterium]